MKATVTLKVKLETTEQIAQSLSEIQKAYVVALNHTSEVVFEKQVFKSAALHHITHRDVRELTKLPANIACSVRNVVAEAYKRDKGKHHRWKETAAMRYGARTLRVKPDKEYVTLTTLDGIVRIATLSAGKVFNGGIIKYMESVDARNKSRRCHNTCWRSNRKSRTVFVCIRCGHKSNAGFNASLNVRDRRAPFTDASP
ncbi:MAG: hypothetical protein J2P21_25910 [Chloracidobacterium sp.]|nr:hypothetical protein [Chloracidobacterium sp.]